MGKLAKIILVSCIVLVIELYGVAFLSVESSINQRTRALEQQLSSVEMRKDKLTSQQTALEAAHVQLMAIQDQSGTTASNSPAVQPVPQQTPPVNDAAAAAELQRQQDIAQQKAIAAQKAAQLAAQRAADLAAQQRAAQLAAAVAAQRTTRAS